MFADVGLGTDKRQSIRTPVASVVHLGRVDYVFVLSGEADFEAREVAVGEAQRKFSEAVPTPADVRVRWIGMFENLERAGRHFALLIPLTIGLIYVLLVATFGTHREAALVLLSAPFAFIGGAVALYLRGMNLNVSSGVGFAALFGGSIMNGVVMVEWITELRRRGLEFEEAVVRGSQDRFRSVLMASLVAVLGLLPASIATGLGSDVQRPLATVIVWGLACSTVLTLLIVPVLYALFSSTKVEAADA